MFPCSGDQKGLPKQRRNAALKPPLPANRNRCELFRTTKRGATTRTLLPATGRAEASMPHLVSAMLHGKRIIHDGSPDVGNRRPYAKAVKYNVSVLPANSINCWPASTKFVVISADSGHGPPNLG